MAVNKIKRDKAIAALVKAGMAPSTAARYVRMLDINEPLAPQIAELAEDLADLFDGSTDDNTEDEEPMTAAQAVRSRLSGRHRLTPERPEGQSPAARNAAALGAGRERKERPTTASAAAQAAAARLRTGIGRAAD